MSKKPQKSLVERYELVPTAIIGTVAALISWAWWNWREAVLNFSSHITPVGPFSSLGESLPFFGERVFPSYVLGALAIAAVAVLLSKLKTKRQANILRALTHAVAGIIALRVFWDFWHWFHLDSQWYQETTFYTGKVAITFLFLSLACTPLNTLFDWKALNQLKKPLGNWGFGFAFVHLMLFVIDNGTLSGQFMPSLVIQESLQKRYVLIGWFALLLLLPLFATSNKWAIKQLGKRWKRLHQLVYVINVLAVLHYFWVWSSKRAFTQPAIYAVTLAFLLLLRLDWVKAKIRDFKRTRRAAQRAATS